MTLTQIFDSEPDVAQPPHEVHHEKNGFPNKLTKLSYGYEIKVHILEFQILQDSDIFEKVNRVSIATTNSYFYLLYHLKIYIFSNEMSDIRIGFENKMSGKDLYN